MTLLGKNFGAGMSGGIAYVLVDDVNGLREKCNMEMIDFEKISSSDELHSLRELHASTTSLFNT